MVGKLNFLFQVASPEGGWVTKSNLTLKVDPMDRNKIVYCYAINSALGETIVEKHIVSVLCKYEYHTHSDVLHTSYV